MLYYDYKTDSVEESPAPHSIPIGIPQHTGPNTSFSNNVQFAWDSTSLGLFKTCPRKYQYTIIEGWHAKIVPPPLAFGIYLHRIFQLWHQMIAEGYERAEALLRCVKLAGLLGEKLPRGDNTRSKEQLVRATVWYLQQFWTDPAKTVILSDGSPAVEYSFTLPLFSLGNDDIYLCGHIDRFAIWQGRVLAQDYKTTKYPLDDKFIKKFKPHNQFPIYVIAAHLIAGETQELASTDGILLDGVQLGVNFNRYLRHIVPFSPEEINEYIADLRYWISTARMATEANHFPANEEACGNYGGCPFREICTKSPARREDYLRGNFTQRTWDPMRER